MQIMDGSTGTDRNCHTGGAFAQIRVESPVKSFTQISGTSGCELDWLTGGVFGQFRGRPPDREFMENSSRLFVMESKRLMGGAFTQMPAEPADEFGQKPSQHAKEPEFSRISARSQSSGMSTDTDHLERRVLKSSELRRTPLRVQPCQKESPSEGVTSMSRCRRLRSFLSELVPKRVKQCSVFMSDKHK